MKTGLIFTDDDIRVVIAIESPIWKYHEKYDDNYYIKDDQVNECKYWKNVRTGIWFSNNHWCIGDLKHRGTGKCVIKAPGSSDQLPTDLQGKWLFWNPDSKQWINAGNDITVTFWEELPYNKDCIE